MKTVTAGWMMVGSSEESQLFLVQRWQRQQLVLHNGWEVGGVIHPRHLHPWPDQDVARKEETAADDSCQWKTFDHFC